MENTDKILLEDDTSAPQWYIAIGERWIGPLTAEDVYEKILSHEITWAHYAWKKGQSGWKRICDIKTFQAAVPHQPEENVQVEVKEAAVGPMVKPGQRRSAGPPPVPAKDEKTDRIWFLHYHDTQFGPFSADEVSRFLKIGKIHGRVHAWRDGMGNWERLERIAGFEEAVVASKAVRAKREPVRPEPPRMKEASPKVREQRETPRRPLVARILMANEESVNAAICRDISVGGMQVLTDRVPAKVGAHIRMNVSPAGEGRKSIEPFVAEGVIVRVLEDGRGFSFRFDRLSNEARKVIEQYIASAE